jgi:sulfite reductase beta subunit-like hemoprotein
VQFNWIPLEKSADVMDLLASVDMHGIQTSGNCIRNITSDELAGIAPTRSPTRARLPKYCASGARCTPSSPSAPQVQDRHHRRHRGPRCHRLARRGPAPDPQ